MRRGVSRIARVAGPASASLPRESGLNPELPPQLWPGSFAPTKPLGKIRLGWEGRRNSGDPASQETCP